jgi:Glycosyl hydrolase family 12
VGGRGRARHGRRPLASLTAVAALVPALIVLAPPAAAGTVQLCGKGQHINVRSWGGVRFTVRNDYFLQPGCLSNRDKQANFTVTTAYAASPHGKVVSFPDIFRGCSWGVCSPQARLPAQVSRLPAPSLTWQNGAWARGRYNAAFDIWFSKHYMTTGQAEGAELMIWLKTHDLPPVPSAPRVWIGHHRYYLLHWIARRGASAWNYIQFRRAGPTHGVAHLALRPFIRRAEQLGWIRPAWWLDNVEAGYEIWWGGKGLSTTRFWVTP